MRLFNCSISSRYNTALKYWYNQHIDTLILNLAHPHPSSVLIKQCIAFVLRPKSFTSYLAAPNNFYRPPTTSPNIVKTRRSWTVFPHQKAPLNRFHSKGHGHAARCSHLSCYQHTSDERQPLTFKNHRQPSEDGLVSLVTSSLTHPNLNRYYASQYSLNSFPLVWPRLILDKSDHKSLKQPSKGPCCVAPPFEN